MKKRCLRYLEINKQAVINHISARGELGRRIRDMGLVPGTSVTVMGRAPLKDPVCLRLKDCTLALRNSEADWIFVAISGE